MLNKLFNAIVGKQTNIERAERESPFYDKYYRYRHAMGMLNDKFPFLNEVVQWVENTSDYNDLQMKERCYRIATPPVELDLYNLVAFYKGFRDHLVAIELFPATSRKAFLYMDFSAANVLHGYDKTVKELNLTVTNPAFIGPLEIYTEAFVQRHAHRNKCEPVKINLHHQTTLDSVSVVKAELFSNIPCLVPESNIPQEESPHV